ncbi:Protein RTM1 [Fusarium oxysporum f. sp. albedinis]|nr:Protein RTM1 [Fusarium oxysporum f. sp. albedinis]
MKRFGHLAVHNNDIPSCCTAMNYVNKVRYAGLSEKASRRGRERTIVSGVIIRMTFTTVEINLAEEKTAGLNSGRLLAIASQ